MNGRQIKETIQTSQFINRVIHSCCELAEGSNRLHLQPTLVMSVFYNLQDVERVKKCTSALECKDFSTLMPVVHHMCLPGSTRFDSAESPPELGCLLEGRLTAMMSCLDPGRTIKESSLTKWLC